MAGRSLSPESPPADGVRADHTRRLKALYRAIAPHYESEIAPVFAALAAHLCDDMRFAPTDCVLDIGTGTGAVARRVAPEVRAVVGIDLSAAMLRAGVAAGALACADVHALPFPTATFDAALAAFCFNETEPIAAFAEVFRVLRAGGRLALLEWGPPDTLMQIMDDTLAEYAVNRAQGFHAEMRRLAAEQRPWDAAVSSCADLVKRLHEATFVQAACEVITARVPFTDAEAFARYALAWPPRRVEVEAMPPSVREEFSRSLRARLGAGALVWEPALFRAVAVKPS